MRYYDNYPKQINSLIEMIDEYKGLLSKKESLGNIYEYSESDADFDHDKWFELEDRISYFPNMDIKDKKIIATNETVESFEDLKIRIQKLIFQRKKRYAYLNY